MFEYFQLLGGFNLFVIGPGHMLVRLRQKTARATAGIIHRFINLRINHLHHYFDDLPGREELTAVVALFSHFQKQTLIDLRKGEDVRRVDGFGCELMHLVQHIQKFRSVSIRTRSTPERISLITF